jgi:acyl-CoA oxidase
LRADLGARLARAKQATCDPFGPWNDLLPLARDLGEASAWSLVVETYVAAVLGEPQRTELAALCGLYVLDEVSRHTGLYLAEAMLTANQVRSLLDLLNDLCERILPAAEELVDAFGIPTGLVAAEIG